MIFWWGYWDPFVWTQRGHSFTRIEKNIFNEFAHAIGRFYDLPDTGGLFHSGICFSRRSRWTFWSSAEAPADHGSNIGKLFEFGICAFKAVFFSSRTVFMTRSFRDRHDFGNIVRQHEKPHTPFHYASGESWRYRSHGPVLLSKNMMRLFPCYRRQEIAVVRGIRYREKHLKTIFPITVSRWMFSNSSTCLFIAIPLVSVS